jgi:2-dehydropantoate 2-reductase
MDKLRYAVIGTGAIGGYFGGKLAADGNDVHFLLHSDYDQVNQKGLRVDSVKGNFTINPANAYKTTADMPACDVVLVCLKAHQNHLLKTILHPILHKNTLVILLQNGIGFEQKLAQEFPALSIAGGLAFICSHKAAPGQIVHEGLGSLKLGMYATKNDYLPTVCADFIKAEVPTELTNDLNTARWQKLLWNIPYNGLSVVLNTTTDRLMHQLDARALVFDLMMEVVEAAQHCGANLHREAAEKMMAMTDKMKPYAPSMMLDYEHKRPMEIEAIYTQAIETAAVAGYEMKKTRMLEQELRFVQEGYLKQ